MAEVPMYYMGQGDFGEALLWVFNNYIGYGIIWLLIGIAIFATVHEKSRSAGISGMIFSMFLALINAALPVEIQAYFTVIIGVVLFMIVYKVAK